MTYLILADDPVFGKDSHVFYVSPGRWSTEYPDAMKFSHNQLRKARLTAKNLASAPLNVRIIGDYGMESELEITLID